MGRRDATDEANWRDYRLEAMGLLDPDQPTESAHVRYRNRLREPFTPDERAAIRTLLNLAVEGEGR